MDAQSQALIKAYIKNKLFLVVEPTVAGKTAIEKMLQKTAVARKNVKFSKTAENALDIMKDMKPNYIICLDKLEDGTYKEILELHLKQHPNRLDNGFILLTENDSVDSVTRLAQSEIDAAVILPFTVTSLQTEFLKIILPKSAPSEYKVLIEAAREHMRFDLDKALIFLKKAKKADPKPFEALYLEGMIHLSDKALELAKDSFEKSLHFNPTYYNSLKELFNIYISLKERARAYQISKKLSENFPVNPEMIPDLAWVSVANAQYDDILNYHQAFKNVDEPDRDMKNYISASLAIYGKKIIKDKLEGTSEVDDTLVQRAFNLMEEASVVCEDKPLVFASLINTLILSNNEAITQKVLERAKSKFPKNKTIKILEILAADATLAPSQSLKNAQDAVKTGLKSPEIYQIILKRSIELGLNEKAVNDYLVEASQEFPQLKPEFEKIISG
ncbi:MAG: hypothetical protein VX341_05025 [Bdellovibrionota bacterium]|nr:hypothetical protein [Bdellovibrionota bacterium]